MSHQYRAVGWNVHKRAYDLVAGVLALVQFHTGGDANPLVSLLTTSTGWLTVERFPFQIPGAVAQAILVTMGTTSHDFWRAP